MVSFQPGMYTVDRRSRATLSSAESGVIASPGAAMWMPKTTVPDAQALHRQRVVDLGRGRIVDREGLARGQRQRLLDRRHLQRREGGALGEGLEQEAPPVELVRAVDRARGLQQIERRALRAARGFDHGLVFGAVLVRLEQDAVELLADRRAGSHRRPARRPTVRSAAACCFLRSMPSSAALTVSSGAFLNMPLPRRRK